MTIVEYAEKIGLLKYLNNQSIDILERAQKAIENKEDYHVIVRASSARLLLQTIILKYEGYLEGCADGRADVIEEFIIWLTEQNITFHKWFEDEKLSVWTSYERVLNEFKEGRKNV